MARKDAVAVGDGLTSGLAALAHGLGGSVVRRGEVTGVFSGLPIPHFNPIHCWRDSPDLADDLEAVLQQAETLGLKVKIVVTADADHESTVADVARRHGFVPREETAPGMVLRNAQVPPLPEGLTCSRPDGSAGAAVVAEITADAFEMPLEFSSILSTEANLAAPSTEWFLLSANGRPVATAMLAMAGDVAAVFNVAVPSALRRQGFGAAATWEVIRRGAELGAVVTALESSALGEPVYRRMGFDVICRNQEFFLS